MKVVVVESPAKAKTINKYLGKDFTVLASYGHVRDLPAKDGSVDPDNGFSMLWNLDERAKKQIQEISNAVKKADTVYLATDPDREGEAISWHVREVLNDKKLLDKKLVQRVVFYEVTKNAVQHAIANPRELDEGLIQAYLARRALDYLVGFNLSPVLWRKLPGSRSAGRVQSVALRLVSDREAEIESFIPQEYWSLTGLFEGNPNKSFKARLTHLKGEKLDKFTLGNQGAAQAAHDEVIQHKYAVSTIERKQVKRSPAAPFITSTLQQEASRKLRYSARKTMQLAQKLYEGISIDGETVGLITYMRTDSTNVAQEAIAQTRALIEKNYGEKYLPSSPRVFKSKAKNAQEAHEAIRPTDVSRSPKHVQSFLDPDLFKLYELIWVRMLASQMENALFNQVGIDITSGNKQNTFRATGSTLVFDGFLKLYEEGKDDEEAEDKDILPPLEEGESLALNNLDVAQHFTQAPPRYTEASLVKRLEELGIGRPSTYASILSTLVERKYVRIERRQLIPEALGRLVTTFLLHYFKKYVEYDFTAGLETQLDDIAGHERNWQEVMQEFWGSFKAAITEASNLRLTEVIDNLNHDLGKYLFPQVDGASDRKCPECADGVLSLKLGKFGAFVGCSNYPTCNHTRKLTSDDAAKDAVDGASEDPNMPRPAKFETKELGVDPESGLLITLRQGPYGFYIQWGEAIGKTKPKRVSLPKSMTPDQVDLDKALNMTALPKSLGPHPKTGEEISVGAGRFGPYVKYMGKFASIPKTLDPLELTLDQALEVLAKKNL